VSRRPLPHTESASNSCLALPFFPTITEEQVTQVCAAVREIIAELGIIPDSAKPQYEEAARTAS
jgi:DegT/DnrJ/EryC1/StrS aminotransferase family